MKKLSTLFAVALIAISLVACKHPANADPAATTDTTTTDTTTTATTTTPDPETAPSDETVTKDYYISPVTSIANLEGSNWYFQTTIDDAATLTELQLGDVATAITVVYTYKFKPYEEGEEQTGPKPGEFNSDFELTFKDTVPEENYEDINDGVRDSFPNFNFTWSTEGNNITININPSTALSAVFDNGSITITYPAQLAGEMNMNDGTEDVSLTLSQCYTIFYDGYIFTDEATPLDLTIATINTDYKKNGLNIDLTNTGIEKFISMFSEMMFMGLPMNETKFYISCYKGQLVYPFPQSFISKGEFVEGNDYTIAQNGYVIVLTDTGFMKFYAVGEEFFDFLEEYVPNNPGIYYDTKLIDQVDLNAIIDSEEYTLNTDYKIVMNSVFLSDSGLEKLIAAIKASDGNDGNLYLAIYSEEETALFFDDEDLSYFTVSEDYNIWDNGLIVEFTETGHSKMI